jgi:hypothetical protein
MPGVTRFTLTFATPPEGARPSDCEMIADGTL